MNTKDTPMPADRIAWKRIVARYKGPLGFRSVWQLLNTFVPYFALLAVMVWSLRVSYIITLLLAIPAAGFAVRLFIIAHDCGHRSFFKTKRANDFWGSITSFFVLTPYVYWRNEHARHHASSGDLDRRGIGDIWTLTVSEYSSKPLGIRLLYRLYRHPFVLFALGPLFVFVVKQRYCSGGWTGRAERLSVLRTNLMLVSVLALAHYTLGLKALFLVQFPVVTLAATAGVWLFYVQHQFENGYWARAKEWDFFRMAIEGSSFYSLPRILQWFAGNIGYHHVHHLSPRIPNYRLAKCHRENSIFQSATTLTLRSSLQSVRFRLWDERHHKMVGFGC